MTNVAEMKRILRVAYCNDGWQTIEEHDDCVATMNNRPIWDDSAHQRKLAAKRKYARRAYRERKAR